MPSPRVASKAACALVRHRGRRRKLWGQVFKKAGWRSLSVVVWGEASHKEPLCLVSDLPPDYALVALYRQRYAIETGFRDFKTYGFNWRRGQVSHLDHVQRLLVAMTLTAWLALRVGTQCAAKLLAKPPSTKRRSRPFLTKLPVCARPGTA